MADPVALTPELHLLVDSGQIPLEVALETMRASPKIDEFTGAARCLNAGCEMRETDRPVRMRRSFTDIMAVGMPLLLHRSEHVEVVDDADITCPECKQPCALLASKPPVYQQMVA